MNLFDLPAIPELGVDLADHAVLFLIGERAAHAAQPTQAFLEAIFMENRNSSAEVYVMRNRT